MAVKFKLGDTLVFGVRDHAEASDFYHKVFGFTKGKTSDDYTGLETGGKPLFLVNQDGIRQPIFEVTTADVATAVEFLERNGCLLDEKLSEDAGDPVVRDPQGYVWCITRDKG